MSHAQFASLQANWDTSGGSLMGGPTTATSPPPPASSSSPAGPATPPTESSVFGRLTASKKPSLRPTIVPQSPTRSQPQPHNVSPHDVVPSRALLSRTVRTGVAALQRQAVEADRRPNSPKRTQSYLKNLEDLREREQKAAACSRKAREGDLCRDERLRLKEALDLKPGPWDFGPGKHLNFEPYSSHRLRVRSLPFDDFQEIMAGRYFLSPSLLYSIKEQTRANKGTDGDFHVPVDGDFVIIATIISQKRSWSCKARKLGQESSSEDEDVFEQSYGHRYTNKKKSKKKKDTSKKEANDRDGEEAKPIAKRNANGELQIEEEDRGRWMQEAHGRYYDMADLSERDDGTGIKGHNQLSLSLVSSQWDPERNQWVGGSRGAYEKLSKEAYAGQVVAFVSPRIVIPKRPEKGLFGRTNLQINPRSAESVHIIGTCLDFALCEAIKKDGHRCNETVDRRNIRQGSAICNYHLSRGVTKTQHGRQEFANGTTAIGHGQSGGYGKGFESWRLKGKGSGGGDSSTPDDIWAANATEMQSHPLQSKQQGSTVHRKWGALSFEGLQGPGKFFLSAGEAKSKKELEDLARDPTSARFSVSERYGREKAEKEARSKKKEEEEEMLRRLEITRAGFDPEKIQSSQRLHSKAEAEEQVVDGLALPSSSVGALAIADARKTLEARKEQARSKEREAIKRRKIKHAGKNPGTNDRLLIFPSDSDSEGSVEKQQRSTVQPVPTSSSQSKFRHSAEAIRRMGFDPLSDARFRENRRAEQSSSDAASRSALLARHTAAPSSLPKPSLKTTVKGLPSVRPPVGANEDSLAGARALKFGKMSASAATAPQGNSDYSHNFDSDSDLEII